MGTYLTSYLTINKLKIFKSYKSRTIEFMWPVAIGFSLMRYICPSENSPINRFRSSYEKQKQARFCTSTIRLGKHTTNCTLGTNMILLESFPGSTPPSFSSAIDCLLFVFASIKRSMVRSTLTTYLRPIRILAYLFLPRSQWYRDDGGRWSGCRRDKNVLSRFAVPTMRWRCQRILGVQFSISPHCYRSSFPVCN